ncbi:MAG: sugar phosphate nucleotidyltransferase [Nitriliruptoraceae bacterium]
MSLTDAMIVAGGAGTRLWPLTATTPKPLLPFCGEPFLAGVLARLAEAGVERVWLIVGADTAPFRGLDPWAQHLGLRLETVPEPEPLDTAGGVRTAAERVADTFLVLNGDILTDVDLTAAVAAHRRASAVATLVLTRVDDTSAYGVCVREGSRIVGFVEKPAPGELPGQDAVNAGTYVLEPDAVLGFPPGPLSFERTVFPQLVADGQHVEGFVSSAVWADLGTRERYLEGHRLALEGELRWPTLGERWAPDVEVAATAQVAPTALLCAGARVGEDARIGPHVVLGRGSQVGAGAQLDDTVLDAATTVGDDSRLRGVVTGASVRIGCAVTAVDGALVGAQQRIADATTLSVGATVPARA